MPEQSAAAKVARKLLSKGWRCVPLKGKIPLEKGWQNWKITDEEIDRVFTPSHNIGLLLGDPSGGIVDIDCDTPEAVTAAGYLMPETGMTFGRESTGQAHMLYLSPNTKTTKYKDINGNMLLEVRSTGGQTMIPPSIHPSGEKVSWIGKKEPAEIDSKELLKAARITAAATLLAIHWPESGTRQDAAMHLSGALAHAGWEMEEITKFLTAVLNASDDDEPDMRLKVVEYAAEKISKDEPVTGWPKLAEIIDDGDKVVNRIREWMGIASAITDFGSESCMFFNRTDTGNAERLVRHHGEDLRYCYEWGKWMFWNGCRWKTDNTGEIFRRAKDTVRQIGAQASLIMDETERKAVLKWALQSESRARQRDMIALAERELPITQDKLDADKWLLNVQNGTIDLKTGALLPHDRDRMLTKLAPVSYTGEESDLWNKFLERVLPDKEVRDFVQRAVGYSLTGDCGEEVLFFLYGTGRNGKSKFIETIQHVLGDYASSTRPEVLMEKKHDSIPVELAALKGVRFTSTVETGQGQRFAESLVKQATGGDELQVRHMRQDPFTYKPQFKIWLASNNKPDIRGRDQGIWSRIKLIPFTVTIPPEERDRHLGDKLKADAAGVLTWAVEGCLAWQRKGLKPPQQVVEAIQEYQEETDRLSGFFEDCCTFNPLAKVTTKELYSAYEFWCDDNGEVPIKKHNFSKMLSERGFSSIRIGKEASRGWQGIRLGKRDFSTQDSGEIFEFLS